MSMGPVSGPGGPGDLLSALKSGRLQGGEAERLKAATQPMEGEFYQELFKAMRDTIPQDGLMGGGQGEEMFTSLMDQQFADAAAARSHRGIGAALYRHFVRASGLEGEVPPLADGGVRIEEEGEAPMELAGDPPPRPLLRSDPSSTPLERSGISQGASAVHAAGVPVTLETEGQG